MQGGNFLKLPQLLLVHIRKAHTVEQKSTLTSSQKQLDRANFTIGLGPHGKLWAPLIARVIFLLINRIGVKETGRQCHLAYHWFGENLRITSIIAIFVI